MTQSLGNAAMNRRLLVAGIAGLVAVLMALLLFGFAFDAARVAETAPPHWQLMAVSCALLPLLALGGLSPVRAGLRPRLVLIFGGCLGTWALGVYVVASSCAALGGLGEIDDGGGLAISASILALAAIVELVAGLLVLRSGDGRWIVPEPLSGRR
jgi:hypothetical protein